MGSNKKLPLLLLLLPIMLHSCPVQIQHCNTSSSNGSLHCHNNFKKNITCVWNSTCVSDNTIIGADTECTIRAHSLGTWRHTNSCQLIPVDYSRPAIRSCTLVFKGTSSIFRSYHKWSINMTCVTQLVKHNLFTITYKPAHHIKLNAPDMPVINFTSITWSLKDFKVLLDGSIREYSYQLHLKKEAQAWEEVKTFNISDTTCNKDCVLPVHLEAGERYQARVRVQASDYWAKSSWSDWSPTAFWVSPLDSRSALEWDSVVCTVLGAAVALSLAIILCKAHRSHWVQKMRGPPLPNPKQFFLHEGNFKAWLNPRFSREYFHSFLPVDISPVEVTTSVDAVTPQCKEASLPENSRWERSHKSTFSNPSYSHLCLAPISSLTGGNLEPCASNSPYGPVKVHSKEVGGGKDNEDEKGKEMENLKLLSDDGSVRGTTIQVSFDYDRVEELQAQHCWLQSQDSGMGSREEEQVSQDSLEDAKGMNMTAGHGEEVQLRKDREEERGKETDNPQWFSNGGGGVVSRGSIQVSLDHETMEILQGLRCLQSPDSGMGSQGEITQDSLEEVIRINMTGGHDEGEELGKHWEEERGKWEWMENLNVSPSRGVVSRGSIQVSSDYEKVGNLRA